MLQTAVGVEGWEPAARHVPRVPMTVTPNYGVPDSIRASVSATPASRQYATTSGEDHAISAVLAETTGGIRGEGHGRSFAFTGEFKRGVSGLRT
jgi:hypothetical protein